MSGLDEIRAEVEKLTVGPDDFILVRLEHRLDAEQRDALSEAFRGRFAPPMRPRLLILAPGVDLASVPRAELERLLEESA